jgi:pilus assembly protein Flp/PilA
LRQLYLNRGKSYLQFLPPVDSKNINSSHNPALMPDFVFFTKKLHFGIVFAIIQSGRTPKYFRRIHMELIRRFVREEEGQGLVEYALILGLIAVVAIAALTASGSSISSMFGALSGKLSEAATNVNNS